MGVPVLDYGVEDLRCATKLVSTLLMHIYTGICAYLETLLVRERSLVKGRETHGSIANG